MAYIAISNFGHLSAHLNLLDLALIPIHSAIKNSHNPDLDGLCDRGEYFIGQGFIAIQTFVATAYPQTGISKLRALEVPPLVKNNLSFVAAINAGANYCKHMEEWGLRNAMERNTEALTRPALATIQTIKKLTPWDDYTCSNLLAVLLNGSERTELSLLLPLILEWQNNLMEISH